MKKISGVIGCVDGTQIAIMGPSKNDPSVTKAADWCRKQHYSLNVMIVCDADCKILCIDPEFPVCARFLRMETILAPQDVRQWRTYSRGRVSARCILEVHQTAPYDPRKKKAVVHVRHLLVDLNRPTKEETNH